MALAPSLAADPQMAALDTTSSHAAHIQPVHHLNAVSFPNASSMMVDTAALSTIVPHLDIDGDSQETEDEVDDDDDDGEVNDANEQASDDGDSDAYSAHQDSVKQENEDAVLEADMEVDGHRGGADSGYAGGDSFRNTSALPGYQNRNGHDSLFDEAEVNPDLYGLRRSVCWLHICIDLALNALPLFDARVGERSRASHRLRSTPKPTKRMMKTMFVRQSVARQKARVKVRSEFYELSCPPSECLLYMFAMVQLVKTLRILSQSFAAKLIGKLRLPLHLPELAMRMTMRYEQARVLTMHTKIQARGKRMAEVG